MFTTDDKELILNGIGSSPGICIGKAYLVDKEGVDVVEKYDIRKENVQDEVKRFKTAVKKTKDEIQKIIRNIPKDLRQQSYILETHLVLLKDKSLYISAIKIIETEMVNAEWALKKTVANIKSMFQTFSDSYLKERSSDVVHVSDQIMGNLVGAKKVNIADIDKRVILVAKDLSPAETSQIKLELVKGFVTDRGGIASHTGIIARTLEIPAVLGLEDVTRHINNDDIIIVDGNNGKVIIHPSDDMLADYEQQIGKYEEYKATITREGHLPAETADGLSLKILGNIELPEEVSSVINYGGDGIGLYRTEFQYLSRESFPSEAELFEKYKDVVEVMAPKSVTIRTLDINGDKAIAGAVTDEEEANPALGLRAIRYCLKNPDVFITQIRAILRAAAYGDVRILLPMITSYEEIINSKRIIKQAAASLKKEGAKFNADIKIGIMIEVPSAVMMADLMAKEVDFFSIGTNDLIQYALAIDRTNEQVANLYNPLHPAIIRMIKHVSDIAKAKKIKLFMCGEMASDPIHIPVLLGLGIDGLSMNPASIPAVKSMIRSIKAAETRLIIDDLLKQPTTADIINFMKEMYGDLLLKRAISMKEEKKNKGNKGK